MSAVTAWQSRLHIVHYDKRSQLGVLLLVIIHVLLQHIGIDTGVKSENIRLSQIIPSRFGAPQNLPRVDPELYPRVDYVDSQNLPPPPKIYTPLFNNYMRPFQNLPLPPRIYPSFQQLYATLPESTLPSQNIPLFSTIICNPPRIYPSLPEYTPLFNDYNIMRPFQNLPLPPKI